MNLFCFPYSGDSNRCYEGLGNSFGFVEVSTLELPSHGGRAREPLLDNMSSMIDDLQDQL